MTIYLPKEEQGKFFPDLDMISQLMFPKKEETAAPSITLASNPNPEMEEDSSSEEFDWSFIQTLPEPQKATEIGSKQVHYGFNDFTTDFFETAEGMLEEVIDNPNPDGLSIEEVKTIREEQEDDLFDVDHYLADFVKTEEIKDLLAFTPFWKTAWKNKKNLKKQQKAAGKEKIQIPKIVTETPDKNSESEKPQFREISAEEKVARYDVDGNLLEEKKETTVTEEEKKETTVTEEEKKEVTVTEEEKKESIVEEEKKEPIEEAKKETLLIGEEKKESLLDTEKEKTKEAPVVHRLPLIRRIEDSAIRQKEPVHEDEDVSPFLPPPGHKKPMITVLSTNGVLNPDGTTTTTTPSEPQNPFLDFDSDISEDSDDDLPKTNAEGKPLIEVLQKTEVPERKERVIHTITSSTPYVPPTVTTTVPTVSTTVPTVTTNVLTNGSNESVEGDNEMNVEEGEEISAPRPGALFLAPDENRKFFSRPSAQEIEAKSSKKEKKSDITPYARQEINEAVITFSDEEKDALTRLPFKNCYLNGTC
eukprot:TRINITY_DN652_c0_g1_i2.p1 TRINITY_DN652_c0_g1~~TRINITY_DN652_c0_g1_i2.p1  ORF type:complete len:532 (-),score=195.52 TRINITY_DN652_c0_g1_i2:524-2119(-)